LESDEVLIAENPVIKVSVLEIWVNLYSAAADTAVLTAIKGIYRLYHRR
jgi:hypothetical protein